MDAALLLANLRALLERAPDFDSYTATSKEHLLWLGQGHALIARWNAVAAIEYRIAADMLTSSLTRDINVAKIMATLHRAIADLELEVPSQTKTTFEAGHTYDFFRELNHLIASAETSIYIVDPYLDHTVFDHYLTSRPKGVAVRLLLNRNAESVRAAAANYVAQHGNVLEVRRSTSIHDRVIFIDGYVCWVVGQSIKDAAKAKPTYIAPLPPDVVPDKLKTYEGIWGSADAI